MFGPASMHGLHADLNTYACNFRASPACYLSVACGSTHALLLVSYSSFQCWGHCTYMLLVVDTRTLAVDVVPSLRSFRVIRVARVEPEGCIPPPALFDYWCVCKARITCAEHVYLHYMLGSKIQWMLTHLTHRCMSTALHVFNPNIAFALLLKPHDVVFNSSHDEALIFRATTFRMMRF